MKILTYAVLSRDRFCRKFTHFFWLTIFKGLKMRWRTKMDKYEVWVAGSVVLGLGLFWSKWPL